MIDAAGSADVETDRDVVPGAEGSTATAAMYQFRPQVEVNRRV